MLGDPMIIYDPVNRVFAKTSHFHPPMVCFSPDSLSSRMPIRRGRSRDSRVGVQRHATGHDAPGAEHLGGQRWTLLL